MNEDHELVRDRLIEDHARLSDLLLRLVAAFEANDRTEMAALWNQLETGLNAHLDAEEKYLFPELARTQPDEARALLAEHAEIRTRLLELGIRVDLHTIRLDVTKELVDLLRKHAAKEDDILYPWADKNVDGEKRASMLRDIGHAVVKSTADPLLHGRAVL
jgi:hemerythrin-like domain-containing protein